MDDENIIRGIGKLKQLSSEQRELESKPRLCDDPCNTFHVVKNLKEQIEVLKIQNKDLMRDYKTVGSKIDSKLSEHQKLSIKTAVEKHEEVQRLNLEIQEKDHKITEKDKKIKVLEEDLLQVQREQQEYTTLDDERRLKLQIRKERKIEELQLQKIKNSQELVTKKTQDDSIKLSGMKEEYTKIQELTIETKEELKNVLKNLRQKQKQLGQLKAILEKASFDSNREAKRKLKKVNKHIRNEEKELEKQDRKLEKKQNFSLWSRR